MPTRKYDWDSVDWTRPTRDIAQALGAYPTHVSAERKKRAPETREHTKKGLRWVVVQDAPHDPFRDSLISLSALGVLMYMSLYSEDHAFSARDLAAASPDSEYAVRKVLGELEAQGYVRRRPPD